jgi:hypothetical protein
MPALIARKSKAMSVTRYHKPIMARYDQEHVTHMSYDGPWPGDPSIDVGMGLRLIGTAFAQTYEMDHICHQIGPDGYTMQITAKSARQGRSAS